MEKKPIPSLNEQSCLSVTRKVNIHRKKCRVPIRTYGTINYPVRTYTVQYRYGTLPMYRTMFHYSTVRHRYRYRTVPVKVPYH